jgi:RNA polymerase primary sigma factor
MGYNGSRKSGSPQGATTLESEQLAASDTDRRSAAVHTTTQDDDEHTYQVTYAPTDDAVTLYFREVGTIPLLTRSEEVSLAQQIEEGAVALAALSEGGVTAAEEIELNQAIGRGEAAREKLITANTRLVISLAKNYIGQGVPLLDLVQEGNIGLIHAVGKFDWRLGYKFSTYATWWIRQALTRAIADQGRTIRLPVHRHEQVRKLHQATRQLTKEFGREPTTDELAEALNRLPDEIEQLVLEAHATISLEKPIREHGQTYLGELLESTDPMPVDVAEERALFDDIEELLDGLPPREARILELRYGLRDGHEYTLKEVGDRFGLTRERIRQLEQSALHRLRSPRRIRKLQTYLS